MLAAVAGVILTAKMNSGQPNAGVGFEFSIIAAVILGGTSLSGGKGSLLGSLIGITLLRFVTNGMIMMNIDSYWQNVVSGAVIILAVAVDSYRAKRKEMESEKLVKLAEESEGS
jgi:ribose/xylose/arabinose/galactoside ABC-type transport system permease subunit